MITTSLLDWGYFRLITNKLTMPSRVFDCARIGLTEYLRSTGISRMRLCQIALAAILSICLIFEPMVSAASDLKLPGAGDKVAPTIQYIPPPLVTSGQTMRIEVIVTDNVGVADVELFYRSSTAGSFRRIKMSHAPNSNLYSVVMPLLAGARIEYYLQASDAAGNTAILGGSFDPFVLDQPTPSAPAPASNISKWVWMGLGALLLGVLAASGSGSNSTPTAPKTGSVTFTGQTP
jgi:hypothetical protein